MRKPLVLLVIAALALPGPIPAQADPAPQRHQGQRPHQVTLITGDVVTFFDDNQFSVDPAPRQDGRAITFTARTGATIAGAKDLYVYPSDAAGDARLDPELFNVKGLVREGLDRVPTLPVLIKGNQKSYAARKTDQQFWRNLSPDSKVWLNHRRRVSLDRSVAQIGAPEAWAGGHDGSGVTVAVIDTGIDKSHPDLAGKVVAEQNFTEDPDAGDFYGHGTHVASTIAGTGAASGGRYKGVAPGARLVNAKACDGAGFCYDSWIMAAMDFASHSGARVINLSLGGGISDGTDPLSLEVNRLTEETGALFVIAAGNLGDAGNVSVGSPGAAASALTVGAVDRTDKLAPFSSRGPRFGDAGIKPELTAPGVGIVAARAVDTAMGDPVDEHYTAANGTSMATPHTAGAAAILAQRHPDWKALRLKDTLVSTVKPTGGRVIDEGAGRVDVAAAYRATLTATATVDFGRTQRRQLKVRKVTYRNDGPTPVRLELKVSGQGWNGQSLPFGATAITPAIWVPANGVTDAHMLVSTFVGDAGSYSGVITATGGGVTLRTPISYYIVAPEHQLTVRVTDHIGQPADAPVYILRDDFDPERNNDPFAQLMFDAEPHGGGVYTAQVPGGTYSALATVYRSNLTERARWTALSKVDVPVRRATTMQLDARLAVPISAKSNADTLLHHVSFARVVRGGSGVLTGCACAAADAFATPTAAPRFGVLSLQDTWTMSDRTAWFSSGGREVEVRHDPYAVGIRFPGQATHPVVWAGDGTDFTGVDVAGKIALVGLKVDPNGENPDFDAYLAGSAAARKAAAAGASGLAAFVDLPGAIARSVPSRDLPYLGLSAVDGATVRAAGALDIRTKASPDFLYNLHFSAPSGIPSQLGQVVDPAKLTRVQTEYHADLPGLRTQRSWIGFRNGAPGSMINPVVVLKAPLAIAEYVGGSPLPDVGWTRISSLNDGGRNQLTMYNRRPIEARDVWFSGPSSPGAFDSSRRSFYRLNFPGEEQYFFPSTYMGDGSPGHLLDVNYSGYSATKYTLLRDGVVVPPIVSLGSTFPYFPVPDAESTYRLDARTVLPKAGVIGGPTLGTRRLSTHVDTSWTFRSGRRAPVPCYEGAPFECQDETLLQPFYDLGLDLSNNAPAGKAHSIGVTVPSSAGIRVDYSGDDGATWNTATSVNGRFVVVNPGSGFVWLRVSAWTADGSRVEQTVQRAYGVVA